MSLRARVALAVLSVPLTALVATSGVAAADPAVPAPYAPHQVVPHALPHVAGGAGARHNPLLKDVLAEKDADAPDAPSVQANCRRYVGQPNPYRALAPDVDMVVADTTTSAGSGAGCGAAQNETSIATNPADPANIVAGANDYRVFNAREYRNDSSGYAYTSFDGGLTWTDVLLPGLTFQTGAVGPLHAMDGAGDPVIAFGHNNTVYYGNIVFSRGAPATGGTEAPSAIVVNISHDGGRSFGRPTIVQLDGADARGNTTPTRVFNDKIWLAADPRNNRVYVTWTRFLDDAKGGYVESPVVVSRSDDAGRTFTPFSRIDGAVGAQNPGLEPFSQGSNPVVTPDGTLDVAYESTYCATSACDRPSDRDVVVVASSHDGAANFTRTIVNTDYDFPVDKQVGDMTLTGENFRINSYPQLTVDPVTSQLLVTWADDRNGSYDSSGASVRTNGDNIVSTSTDGVAWTRPVVVGTSTDEVFGAVASYGGAAVIASYTRAYEPGGVGLDFAYWPITATPGRPVVPGALTRLTTQTSSPRVQFPGIGADGHVVQGLFIGDYAAVSIGSDRRIHPAWTDFRGNPGTTGPNQDALTRTVQLP